MNHRPVGVLLAAGLSTRFGEDKLVYALADGCPIAIRAAQNLVQVLPRSVAVVSSTASPLAVGLLDLGYQLVVNDMPAQGMSRSLRLGVEHAATATGWVIALADMPWIAPGTIRQVVDALVRGASLAAPAYQGRRGHPVGLASRWRDALGANNGDQGARDILTAHSAELVSIDVADPGVVRDIDTQADLVKSP